MLFRRKKTTPKPGDRVRVIEHADLFGPAFFDIGDEGMVEYIGADTAKTFPFVYVRFDKRLDALAPLFPEELEVIR